MKIHTHKLQNTIKKTLISMGVLLGLIIIAGVVYVYITGRQAEKAAPKEAAVPEEKLVVRAPQEPGPDAPESAAVQYLDSPVKAGENSTITVTTGPKSACTIVMAYKDVVSKDSGLMPKTADAYGSVTWTWTVDKSAAVGKWPVKVTCTRNKKIGYVEGYLEVIR